jgi:DNA-binding beta-propeller fold protein YncE
VSPDGIIDTVAGSGVPGLTDGMGRDAAFDRPMDLAWQDGVLYVVESANDTVRRIDLATFEVTRFAGTGDNGYAGDGGPAVEAQLSGPRGIGVAPDGTVYVADTDNHVVRRIAADGTIHTVLGTAGVPDYDGDGVPPEDSLLNWPNDVAFSPEGDLYVVDTFNDRVRWVQGYSTD